MKRSLSIVFCFLFFGFFLSGCLSKKAEKPVERPKIQETVNRVPVDKRPYSVLSFSDSGRFPAGRELKLEIADGKNAASIEYELEYQAGTLVQAGVGSINPKGEKLPLSRDILLGSCSAGGACSYSEDVKGGTLLLRFKGSDIGSIKGEWNFYHPGNDGKLASRDAKFQLDAPKLKNSYVLVAQTLGLPPQANGELIAGPYHLETTADKTGDMQLTMRLNEESEAVVLWRWDGKELQKIPSEFFGKTLTAKVTTSGTYLVIK
ncbi:hypothetical protein HYU89_03595 [Candidatus Collierbacteria bacterium]|nr:hypothetical protein [Candidatus Collierbacteria bacterium]